MNSKYDKYWYFRTSTDEEQDDDAASSIMLPVNRITGILPDSTTSLFIYFKQHTSKTLPLEVANGKNGYVKLNITQGEVKNVIKILGADLNASDRSNPTGITVIADNITTDFDDTTRAAVYIHPKITTCGAIVNR